MSGARRPADRPGPRSRLSPHAVSSGLLLAAGAAPAGVVHGVWGPGAFDAWPAWVAVVLVSGCWLFGGLVIIRAPRWGQSLGSMGLAGVLGLAWPHWPTSPAGTLFALVGASMVALFVWQVGATLPPARRARRRPVGAGRAQGAAMTALVLLLLWVLLDVEHTAVDGLGVGWAGGVAAASAVVWAVEHRRAAPRRAWAVAVVVAAAVGGALWQWGDGWWVGSTMALPAAVVLVVVRERARRGVERAAWWDPLLLGPPERFFVGTFAALCVLGTLLLALPQSSVSGKSIGLLDALFTSTSAVCVTGLIVLDTPTAFSGFGQGVILLLIQVGGLGIMAFSTVALWALGRRLSLRHEGAMASLISSQDRNLLFATAGRILQFTLGVELVGALGLTAAFVRSGDGWAQGLWRGMFTSVSAFCNAGFALQSDSLVPYQGDPVVLHLVSGLIILGGLSPAVVLVLPTMVRRRSAPIAAQAKLVLVASVVLLGLGFLFYLTFEWRASLNGMSIGDKLHNAWFQSVTLRTAGFNSVDLTAAGPATLTLMLVWMFIGGSPGGTAGGVKTTTVAVLALAVVQAIRGQWTVDVFGKRIPERTRAKAAVVVTIAALTALGAAVAILLTQDMPMRLAVFEVVSALGTVGLSIGGTGALDGIGRVIIVLCMFVGRVGGLSLLMFLSSRRALPRIGRPEEEIDVG